jgi:hypothetical protein
MRNRGCAQAFNHTPPLPRNPKMKKTWTKGKLCDAFEFIINTHRTKVSPVRDHKTNLKTTGSLTPYNEGDLNQGTAWRATRNSWKSLSWSRNPPFMEPEGSLPCLFDCYNGVRLCICGNGPLTGPLSNPQTTWAWSNGGMIRYLRITQGPKNSEYQTVVHGPRKYSHYTFKVQNRQKPSENSYS